MQFNILIADNEVSNLDSIIFDIQNLLPNTSIQKASTFKEIVSEIQNTDILIISTHFHKKESFEFIKSMQAYVFSTIFLTNDAKSDDEVNKASDIGVFDFISKLFWLCCYASMIF